jgi:hypothetical protein
MHRGCLPSFEDLAKTFAHCRLHSQIAGTASRNLHAFQARSQRADPLTCNRTGSHLNHLSLHADHWASPLLTILHLAFQNMSSNIK